MLAAGRRVGRQEQPGAWQASWSSPLAPSAHRPHRIKAAAAAAPLLPLPAPNCAALPPDLPLCSATMTSLSHLLEALEAALQRFRAVATSEQAAQRSNASALALHALVDSTDLATITASEAATLEKWVTCCRLSAIAAAFCCTADFAAVCLQLLVVP